MSGPLFNPAVAQEKFEANVRFDKQARKDIDEILQRLQHATGSSFRLTIFST